MNQKRDTVIHIGFDDTDSLKGSCTTHLAVRIIEKIYKEVVFLDYPRLIRNNPNIPWKTRGNGAIAFSISVNEDEIETIIDIILNQLETYYEKDENTNPGIVVVKGEVPEEIAHFAIEALTRVIEIDTAKKLAQKHCIFHKAIGNGRGLIGGLAAIGNQLKPNKEDFTFELLTYRTTKLTGTKRKVDRDSVIKMDAELAPLVFNNIDEETEKVLICPAGPDPVFYGIRGEEADVLLKAFSIVKMNEQLDSYCIFRTNQGTDQHFKYASTEIVDCGVFTGDIKVLEKPSVLQGGHVLFKTSITETNEKIDTAAFEPSKKFRNTVKQFLPGDILIAYGGIKYKAEFETYTIHLEKCEIIHISDIFKSEAPICPKCSKRMTSDGYKKGYKCKKCGYKDQTLTKISTKIERNLGKKLIIPPAQAQRHLVKPHRRYQVPKKTEFSMIENWWKRYSKE